MVHTCGDDCEAVLLLCVVLAVIEEAHVAASVVVSNVGRTGILPVNEHGEQDAMHPTLHQPSVQRGGSREGFHLDGKVGSRNALDETMAHGRHHGCIQHRIDSVVVIAKVLSRRLAFDENSNTQAHVVKDDHDGSRGRNFVRA